MTDEGYRRRILAIEAWADEQVDLLGSVPSRAPARGGESGAIADAVAGLARRQQNSQQIARIEEAMHHCTAVVEALFYGGERPTPPSEYCAEIESLFDKRFFLDRSFD